jgi:uncharacterized repeat protein (TIGR01451 family)
VVTTHIVRVTKDCPPNPVAPGDLLVFTGSVSNGGNVTLTNVLVVDNQPVPNTAVFGPTNLAPGQVLLFTNSYTVPLDFCGPANDTLTATATSVCGTNVSHTASASCPVVTAPAVRVTKNCPTSAVGAGGVFVFTGTVTNIGNITLTNVLVVDNQPTNNTPVFGPVMLAPGAGLSFTGTYTLATVVSNCTITNTLTATARSICGSNVTHSVSAVCPVALGAIGDFVWEDLNFDGCQGANEPGVTNVTVQLLDCSSNLLASMTTGPQGQYLFTNLCPASYIVRFVAPLGYQFTKQMACGNIVTDSDPNPSNGLTTCTFLNAGETNRTVDAGLFRQGCLGDFIWDDFNRNGVQDTNEPGISNVTIYLMSCGSSNILQTTVTGTNGIYQFCDLEPGTYQITIVVPDGYRMTSNSTTSECLDSDGLVTTNAPSPTNSSVTLQVIVSECATVVSGTTNNCLDIGLHRPGAIGDFVWEDLNFNGIQDTNEVGIPNVLVRLFDCTNNPIASMLTSTEGLYLFTNLPPGGYVVQFGQPAGYVFTLQNAGGDDAKDSDADPATGRTTCYTLASGETNLTVDAGLYRPVCLGDYVFEDIDRNGIQNEGPSNGIPNVTVELLRCGFTNVVSTTVTDTNGYYLFCDLTPGTYRVHVVVPGGYRITVPNQGADDCLDSDADTNGVTDCVTLPSGTTNLCTDIGLFRPAAIGDYVFKDLDHNGIQNEGPSNGVAGVTVQLLTNCASGIVVATTNTDANGYYLFSGLPPGQYRVRFVLPMGYIFTLQDADVDDTLDSDADMTTGLSGCYTLVSGQTNLTVDAGLFPLFPRICVTKEIVCSLPGGCDTDWRKTAIGARNADRTLCPSFCYRITVTNCGDVTLTNVTLTDQKLGLVSYPLATEILPGAVTSIIFSNVTQCTTTTNVVTATGQSAITGASVSAMDSATAVVREASIVCSKIVSSPDAVSDTNSSPQFLLLPDNGLAHMVTFSVIVRNDGEVPLTNVTVNDPILSRFDCPAPQPFSLAPGASTNITLCTVLLDCSTLPLTNTIRVTGAIDAATSGLCAFDTRTNAFVSVTSTCEAVISCTQPGGCRMTGGGKQPATSTFPRVRYVTHGGQVGAPVGTETHFDPDSACIHGNLEHVRHIQGGLRGNFHAKSYDSLMCACLSCAENPANPGKVGELCNPGDRICGPEPRRAPANKITFSGVGDYVITRGRRIPRSVIFRVDIEDRSEPGGSHPGGQTPPPDRYRIRIWILTAAELAKLKDPADRLLTMREAIAASNTNTPLKDGAVLADGVTPVPLGTAVFGIRAPDIDDGGELERGNHQIHPSIKACP